MLNLLSDKRATILFLVGTLIALPALFFLINGTYGTGLALASAITIFFFSMSYMENRQNGIALFAATAAVLLTIFGIALIVDDSAEKLAQSQMMAIGISLLLVYFGIILFFHLLGKSAELPPIGDGEEELIKLQRRIREEIRTELNLP